MKNLVIALISVVFVVGCDTTYTPSTSSYNPNALSEFLDGGTATYEEVIESRKERMELAAEAKRIADLYRICENAKVIGDYHTVAGHCEANLPSNLERM